MFGLLQPTAWLLAALIVSLAWPRRPARGHAVVVLALLGLLLTPPATLTGRRLGWGILPAGAPAADETFASTSVARPRPHLPGFAERRDDPLVVEPRPASQPSGDARRAKLFDEAAATVIHRPFFADWHGAAWALWGMASIVLGTRTLAGTWRARRLLRQSGARQRVVGYSCVADFLADEALSRFIRKADDLPGTHPA